MRRSFDERILWYFYKNASSTTLFLLVLAAAFSGVGASRENQTAFFAIGVGLFLIAVWQILRGFFIEVKGSEVDVSVKKFINSTNMERNARYALELEPEDMERIHFHKLHGYCCMGIETEPLYRWDETDGMARSSNYQYSCIGVDKGVLLVYTAVKSLVDAEYCESSHIWSCKSIEDIQISSIPKSCAVNAKKNSERKDSEFTVMIVTRENGEEFAFSIASSMTEEQIHLVEQIRDTVIKENGKEVKLRKPALKDRNRIRPTSYFDSLSKHQRRTLEIGIIGDAMEELK